jgi:hypothetical protein
MDITKLIKEFICLRNKSTAEGLADDETIRLETLKKAMIIAEKMQVKNINTALGGAVRLRFFDGVSVKEIRLSELVEPVLDVELNAGATEGYKIVVVDRERGPASAVRAKLLGRSDKGPRWYRIDLGQAVLNM